MKNIGIRKMRIFLAAVEERSFTRAAMKQNISQPAATIVINQIEETVGDELFQRTGNSRRAVLTPRGQIIAQTFSRIVANYDSELLRISDASFGKRSEKRVLIQSSFAQGLNMAWLNKLLDTLDGERIIIEEGSRAFIVDQISGRKANLGVVDGDIDSEKADYMQTDSYELVLAVPASVQVSSVERGLINWDQIPKDSYLLCDIVGSALTNLRKNFMAAGGAVDQLHIVKGICTLGAMMLSRPQCAIVPSVLADTLPQELNIQKMAFSPTSVQVPFGIVTPWGYLNQLSLANIRNDVCFQSRTNEEKNENLIGDYAK